ncbi:hypothetical protein [Blastococcus montanus]|uniref:hypothetical protein n=1 Tax=Blastococcus montanus TaxID=3144973 RepID=UPI003207AEE4
MAALPEPRSLTDETAARRLRISRTRLTDFEQGRRFFEWDLPWRIKALIDPAPDLPETGTQVPTRR